MILNDFRTAYRSLRRSPLFVVVATLTLGIGIGLTTTMLSMLDAITHPYVPYRNPDQLLGVMAYGGGSGGQVRDYEKRWALIEGTRSFQGLAAWSISTQKIRIGSGARMVFVRQVSDNYFSLLGVTPELGRGLMAGAADESSAAIGFGLWQAAFGSRSLDQELTLTVGDRTYRVIGVMPPEMDRGLSTRYGQVWIRAPAQVMGTGFPVVRLRDGVSMQSAYAELGLVATRLKETFGEGKQAFQFRLDPLQPPPGELRDHQKAMGAAGIFILVIACANLANLMLVRGLTRRKELSLRLALGAGRAALVRQLLTESVVIAALGGVAGAMLTIWGVGAIRQLLPSQGWFGFVAPHLSIRVYLVATVVTALSVLTFGVGPAVAASGVRVSEPLKETTGTTSRRTRRAYNLVVVGQVALCLTLLMGAGLLLRSVLERAARDIGFNSEGLVTTQVRLTPRNYPDPSGLPRAFQELTDHLAHVPGVVQVATRGEAANRGSVITSDFEGDEPRLLPNTRMHHVVSWNYLRVLGIPIVAGRDFEPGDEDGNEPVAIVSDSVAAHLWPGMNAVGRMITLGSATAADRWVRVIGVSRYFDSPSEDPGALVVWPRNQAWQEALRGPWGRLRHIVVRVNEDETVMNDRLDRELRAAIPANYVGGFERLSASWEQGLVDGWMLARLFGVFGLVSLALAAIGLYGVLAYAVSQRLREFGLRIALGAVPRDLWRLVLRDGAVMILGGTAIGAWVAMAGAPYLSGTISVPATDATSLVIAELTLMLVAFLACLAPARRAAKADPMQIVRAL